MSNEDFSKLNDKPLDLAAADSGDEVLLASIRHELDRSCAALDGYTLSRLHRIRSEAVARRRKSRLQSLLLPFGGLVTACALVIAVSLNWHAGSAQPASIEDIEILADSEALDFYSEYEFYQWMAQE